MKPSLIGKPNIQSISTIGEHRPFSVVALVAGEPGVYALWTLFKLSDGPWALRIVRARGKPSISKSKRLRRLIQDYGIANTISRFVASRVIGAREDRTQLRLLDQLFDGARLRAWWEESGLPVVEVPHLNHVETVALLREMTPDVIIRVSGGILKPEVFSQARRATVNIHHGQAPRIRGMWSIPWGIIEGREDWIGATIHVIDAGIDTGNVLWRATPQIAPGDRGVDLFFRAHLEAVEGLAILLRQYCAGTDPTPLRSEQSEQSFYRSAPGLFDWFKYLALGRGIRAKFVLEKALEC